MTARAAQHAPVASSKVLHRAAARDWRVQASHRTPSCIPAGSSPAFRRGGHRQGDSPNSPNSSEVHHDDNIVPDRSRSTLDRRSSPPHPKPSRARGLRRLLTGPSSDPGWARPALAGLLGVAAVLYIWGLGSQGWANAFYAAAVQAGTKSWKAFFFGSFDASSFITVDKPPAALWVMELSARIFGLNSWSLLIPQALEGVATVGILTRL